jgi:hypothetical protein
MTRIEDMVRRAWNGYKAIGREINPSDEQEATLLVDKDAIIGRWVHMHGERWQGRRFNILKDTVRRMRKQ